MGGHQPVIESRHVMVRQSEGKNFSLMFFSVPTVLTHCVTFRERTENYIDIDQVETGITSAFLHLNGFKSHCERKKFYLPVL